MTMQPNQCHVVAHSDGFEVQPLGKFYPSSKPLVAAARWAQANVSLAVVELIIGVMGKHGGFSVCDDPNKSGTIVAPAGQSMRAMRFVGLNDNAEIGSIQLWTKGGQPGPLTFEGLIMRAPSLCKFIILASQNNEFTRCGVTVKRCVFAQWPSAVMLSLSRFWSKMRGWFTIGDTPLAGGALWGVRGHGSLLWVELDQVVSDGFGEHALCYVDNVQERVSVSRCVATDSGRTAVQVTCREFQDKERKIPTGTPATPESAVCSITDNQFVNCGSYAGGKNGWTANGSAVTIAGWPGSWAILRNTFKHTHVGGGGIAVFPDWAKIGSYKTTDGFAMGDGSIQGNSFTLQAGATAGREAVQVGGCRSLTQGANTLGGTEQRVTYDQGGKIGTIHGTFGGKVPF